MSGLLLHLKVLLLLEELILLLGRGELVRVLGSLGGGGEVGGGSVAVDGVVGRVGGCRVVVGGAAVGIHYEKWGSEGAPEKIRRGLEDRELG